jgi:hypothetical protein|tara:strand:+ start:661 stop:1155 length:495 start_codon:yes stop_codon:yes gene_type:complete
MKQLIIILASFCVLFNANAKSFEKPVFLDSAVNNIYIHGKKVAFHSYNKELKFFKADGDEIKLYTREALGYRDSSTYSFIYEYTLDLDKYNDFFVQYNNGKTEVRVVFNQLDKIVLDKTLGPIPYHKVAYDLNKYQVQDYNNQVEVLAKQQRYDRLKNKLNNIF